MKDFLIYKCSICGNVLYALDPSFMTPNCCGKSMELLVPNSKDGSTEHHVPVSEVYGNTVYVRIGADKHPMTDEHHISWLSLQTDKSSYIRFFEPGEEAQAEFRIDNDERVCAIFCYCCVHGLWEKKNDNC